MKHFVRILRNQHLHAATLLSLMLVIFFWTPLSRYPDSYLSSADLLQDFSLLKVEKGHVSGNALLSDAATEMKPWRMFNRDEFAAGRFPFWNSLNGTGCPHFANYQSAVLSPYSIPYYVLDVKSALIAVSFLKLFSLGFLTYLFLRQIRLGFASALLGGTAFMFAGHNVLLLTFPHVGALVVLPGGFLFVERAVQKHLAGQRYAWDLAALTGVTLTGALAGNPEPFYFGMLFVGAYALVRLCGTFMETRREPRPLRRIAPLACSLLACPVLAAGMSSVQTLPFLEYLRSSRVLEQRSHEQTPLDAHFWPLEMFPNVLGNPASPYVLDYQIPPPNFELVNTAHINGFVAFLALLALVFLRRNRYVRFFWIAAALWACYAYDLFGTSRIFEWLPTLDMAPMNRSQGLWLFALACLAALFVDQLVERRGERAWIAAEALLLAAFAFLVAHLLGADRLISEFANVPSPNHSKFAPYVPDRIALVVHYFAAASVLAAGLLVLRGRRARAFAALGLVPLVFFPTGWHWRNYEPVCEERFFYGETELLHELKASVGEERVAILGEDSIPPMANLAWRINLLSNYDGLWVRDFDGLYRVLFGDTYNWRPIMKGSERALQLMATPWVLAKWNWNFLDSGLGERLRDPKQPPARHEILPGHELRQVFRCRSNGLQAVMFELGAYPGTGNHEYVFRLRSVADGTLLREQKIHSNEVRATIYTSDQRRFPLDRGTSPLGREVVFHFDPIADSAAKDFEAEISCADAVEGQSIYGWSFPLSPESAGSAHSGSQVLPGEVWFDYSCSLERYEFVKQIGDYGLYRVRDALPVFHAVGGAVRADDEQECLGLVRAAAFDPSNMVVLLDAEGAPPAPKPASKDAGRLIKTADSERVYCVLDDGLSTVWIRDQAAFLANKFRWDSIETVSREEFERFQILENDPGLLRKLGFRAVAPPEPEGTTPTLLEQEPTHYRMRIRRERPGWLVISQARYPGWVARIAGERVPLLRANYAFNAIELPSGESEIEFSYEPASFRIGLALSAASALLGLLLFARMARARRAVA
ncbi:MAG: YfhO family protein [Planctomycetes bacterium]|nr:YfhO family protein [Planctomycetota bacterium]